MFEGGKGGMRHGEGEIEEKKKEIRKYVFGFVDVEETELAHEGTVPAPPSIVVRRLQ